MNAPVELWPIGTIVRYGSGSTALFRIEQNRLIEGHQPSYYGTHCLGMIHSASHRECVPADDADMRQWWRSFHWRDRDWTRIQNAIADAARLAVICRDHGIILLRGAIYGAAGRTDLVTIAAHSQVLVELDEVKRRNDQLQIQLAHAQSFTSPPADDDGSEFEAEPIEAADR